MSWFRHSLILLLLAGCTYFSLNRGMKLSGVKEDDAAVLSAALNVVHKGMHLPMHDVKSISIAGRDIPLIQGFYTGPWIIYAATPFVWAMRDRTAALKSYTLFLAFFCIVSIYGLILVFSGDPRLSILCALSVATSPYLTSTIPNGFCFSGAGGVGLCCLSLLALVIAARNRSRTAWYASCALTGLSVGFAQQSLAFAIAWVLSVAWMRRELCAGEWRSDGGRVAWRSAALLSMGVASMVLANLMNGWFSVKEIAVNLGTTEHGISNGHYAANVQVRLHQLFEILGVVANRSRESMFWTFFLGTCFGLAVAGFIWTKLKRQPVEKTHLLPLIFPPVIFAFSPFTLFHLGPEHIFILLPLGLAVAAIMPRMFDVRIARLLKPAVAVCVLLGIVVNVAQLRRFWRTLDEQGDYHLETNAIYPLVGWLTQVSAQRVFLMNDGPETKSIWHTLYYLIGSPLEVIDFSHQTCRERSEIERNSPDALRLGAGGYFILDRLHAPESRVFRLLRRLCSDYGRKLERIKDFRRRDGAVVFEVYAIR